MAKGINNQSSFVKDSGSIMLSILLNVMVVPGAGFEPAASGPNALQIMSFVPLAWLALYQLSHPGPEQEPSD
jgi:hypothetical protein